MLSRWAALATHSQDWEPDLPPPDRRATRVPPKPTALRRAPAAAFADVAHGTPRTGGRSSRPGGDGPSGRPHSAPPANRRQAQPATGAAADRPKPRRRRQSYLRGSAYGPRYGRDAPRGPPAE